MTPLHPNRAAMPRATGQCKAISPKSQDEKAKEVAPFLKNLRKMLEEESDEILRWTDDGRAFEIHDMSQMMERILPKYFKHRKYTSFQRQLNYFNFKKWTKSKAVVCTFSNEHFLKDYPDLAWKITRKKSISLTNYKSTKSKLPSSERRSCPSQLAMEPQFDPAWKWDQMAITIPGSKYPDSSYAGSFPSPTDMDMMLQEFDHPPMDPLVAYTDHPHNSRTFHSENPLDPFDWIDQILPVLESDKLENPLPMHAFRDVYAMHGGALSLRDTHSDYRMLQQV